MTQRQQPDCIKRLGETIRKRRLAQGLTQEQLSDLVPCNRNYVGMVERGEQNITFKMVKRFATALKTTIESLTRSAKL